MSLLTVDNVATVKQYEFFKSLFDGETTRAVALSDHAKSNLAFVAIYSAFFMFIAEKYPPSDVTSKFILVFCLSSMAASFLLSLYATNIATYEAIASPSTIIESFGSEPPTDDDFFDDRIIDYAVAYERNSAVNARKARRLRLARYMLLMGVFGQFTYFLSRSL